jgi:D-glycero-D-manno-heptose 1,7-bisphosphate phosphatase
MKAVIMAGGRGTRISSLCPDIPKPMLKIAGVPILERQLACLEEQGITDIIIVIGYLGEVIKSHFGNSVQYIEEAEPLGTAGALFYLKKIVSGDFLLINGDMIFDIDIGRFIAAHDSYGATATILTHPNDHPFDSGLIVYGETGQVIRWYSKEDGRPLWYKNSSNAGIHILSPKILERFDAPVKTDLDRNVLKPLTERGELFAYHSSEYIHDVGTPDRLKQAERDIINGVVYRKNLKNKQRAVFIDRDGTINKHSGFLNDIGSFELMEGAAGAIRRINQSGYLAICVTNQPVIARGELTLAGLREIHNKMETLLGFEGAYLDDIYFCPHHPDSGFKGEVVELKQKCQCRKPEPGMLIAAAARYNIDLAQSIMVGDSETDRIASERAKCRRYFKSLGEFSEYFKEEQAYAI